MIDEILELFNKPGYKAMVPRQIMASLGSDDLTLVMKTLNELEDQHLIIHDVQGHYALLSYFNVYLGIINVKEAGFGFVKVDGLDKDIFVSKSDKINALDGDSVLVKYLKDTPKGPEGYLVDIVERKTRSIIGILKKKSNHYVLQTSGDYSYLVINIMPKNINNAKENDCVNVIITDFGDGHILRGKVDKVLGKISDPGIDIKMKVEASKIDVEFSPNTILELQNLDESINQQEYIDRTNEVIVTIDGADAKDFDDAITVKALDNNSFMLGVYIADVSSFVRVGTSLDNDAYRRSFSTYLPNGVIPMLPFSLSDDLCSLMPGVFRKTLCCEMIIKDGVVVDSNIFKALIKSKGRLTYDEVNEWFNKNSIPLEYSMLNDAFNLSKILKAKRHNEGSLDFETKEAKIILDKNLKAISVEPLLRGDAEEMIEEFMILCNKTITDRIAYLDLPFIYRVHDEPSHEKIVEIIDIAKSMGLNVPKKQNKIHPLFLQQILENEKLGDAKSIFNHLILRSMAKARYSVNNIGHFGLALDNYTHFTSPIRRYSDLIVHRLVKDYLLGENNYENVDLESYLEEASNSISTKEKVIENLERDVDDMKKAEYIKANLGHVYEGIVSGVQKWGFYVELANSIEGLVGSDYLYDHGYWFDEVKNIWSNGKNIKYQIGSKALVKAINATPERGTIDFVLAKGENDERN